LRILAMCCDLYVLYRTGLGWVGLDCRSKERKGKIQDFLSVVEQNALTVTVSIGITVGVTVPVPVTVSIPGQWQHDQTYRQREVDKRGLLLFCICHLVRVNRSLYESLYKISVDEPGLEEIPLFFHFTRLRMVRVSTLSSRSMRYFCTVNPTLAHTNTHALVPFVYIEMQKKGPSDSRGIGNLTCQRDRKRQRHLLYFFILFRCGNKVGRCP
jgi:hypothetical protein